MNHLSKLIIISLSMALGSELSAQTCLPDGITISHQSTIDNFPDYYPGCQVILGDVIITGVDIDVSNVDSLFSINEIQGDLIFEGLDYGLLEFESLVGLYNLTTIGGDLQLNGLMQTTTFEGLNSLESIGGKLWIGANPMLEDISGLSNLTEIDGPVWFSFNPSVNSLEGLENIDPTGIEYIYIAHNELLSDCSISSLCAFLSLNTAPNDATINLNSDGCNSIEEVLEECSTTAILSPSVNLAEFQILPNPVVSQFRISFQSNTSTLFSIRIFDFKGIELVYEKELSDQSRINIGNLSSGLYILQVEFEDGYRSSRKFVKE